MSRKQRDNSSDPASSLARSIEGLLETLGWGVLHASRGIYLGRMAQLESVLGEFILKYFSIGDGDADVFRRALLSEMGLRARWEVVKRLAGGDYQGDILGPIGDAIRLRNIMAHSLPPQLNEKSDAIVFAQWHRGEYREDRIDPVELLETAERAMLAFEELWDEVLGPDTPPFSPDSRWLDNSEPETE